MAVTLAAIGTALGASAAAATATGAAAVATGTALAVGAGAGITALATKKDNVDAPTYNADAERKKAEEAAANQAKKRRMEQTETVNTSALGNTGQVSTGKTVLGG